jgi:CRP/FNR family transcriptional regulator, cyclic AMP receptor protein
MVHPMASSVGDLRTISLFSRCSDVELSELATRFVLMEMPPSGELVLFDIAQPADAMYLLTSGSALLESPEDEVHELHPPALLGEVGALTGVPRSTKVTLRAATCYRIDALQWNQFLFEHPELGLRVLRDVLRMAAEKIHRDQIRIGTMRQNSQWTQTELREVLQLLAANPDATTMSKVCGSIDALIMRNRRVNVRVEPSVTMPAALHLEAGSATVLDLSRTHVSFSMAKPPWAVGGTVIGVLSLAGRTVPISGRVIRMLDTRVTIELHPISEEFAGPLDGYLTRAQLLDILL